MSNFSGMGFNPTYGRDTGPMPNQQTNNSGINPVRGRDMGSAPPPRQPAAAPTVPAFAAPAAPPVFAPATVGVSTIPYTTYTIYLPQAPPAAPPMLQPTTPVPFAQPPPVGTQQLATVDNPPLSPVGPRQLQRAPIATVSAMPGLNLHNAVGSVGCERDYSYLFPSEHIKIHVINPARPPWMMANNEPVSYVGLYVPANLTVRDLLEGMGAVAHRSIVREVTPGGSGRWFAGLEIRGDDTVNLDKKIKEFGWDATRSGNTHVGDRDVLWLYVIKG